MVLRSISAYPYGIGFYTTGKAGISTFIDNYKNSTIKYSVGAGFVYDSAVAVNELFNYRLNAGYENIMSIADSYSSGSPFFSKSAIHHISICNDFGLGIIRQKNIRVWIGPQVDIGCDYRYFRNVDYAGDRYTSYYIKSTMFTLGFGGVLGINVHAGDILTIGFDMGINTNFGVGSYHRGGHSYWIVFGTAIRGIFPVYFSTNFDDKAFGKICGFIRISFIFRVGDVYHEEM